MKIAQVAPVMFTVPPPKYGGIQAVVTELAQGLSSKGHKVVVFAPRGSKFKNKNISVIESNPYPTIKKLSENRYWELHELIKLIELQDNFDIIHLHYEPVVAEFDFESMKVNLLQYLHKPFLITFHNSTHIDKHIYYYKNHTNLWKYNYAFISKNQKSPLSFLPNSQVIYNGIPVKQFSFNNNPKDYLLFLGRLNRIKGVLEAIQVAKILNKKLIIAGNVDPGDLSFFKNKVKNLIDGKQIRHVGEVNFKQKNQYYKNAICTLVPITWHEPFGLIMAESLACGTPVVAFNRGSAPELVKNGRTGFIVNSVAAMAQAVKKIPTINRFDCRKYAENNFSTQKMVKNYLDYYKQILARENRSAYKD